MGRRQADIHERIAADERPATSTDKSFGIVFAVVFALVGGWILYRGGTWWSGFFGASALMLALAFLKPSLLNPFNRLWTAFGLLLHKIVNPIVMAVVFVIGVAPTALIMRIFRVGTLELKFDKASKSYWSSKEEPALPPESYKRQF